MNILNKPLFELQKALGTDFEKGLSKKSVSANTAAFGLNIPFEETGSFFTNFFKSLLSDVMPWLFVGVLILSSFFEQRSSLTVPLVLFCIYIALRFMISAYTKITERKINTYRQITCNVIRSGKNQQINAQELVPGDILILNTGDFVPCDCIVISCENFSVYESFITSEHQAVYKFSQQDLKDFQSYHSCLVFTGSAIASGSAKVLVCNTGKNIFNIKNTPLKKVFTNQMPKIHKNNLFVGKQLYLLWILMCFVVFIIGIVLKYDIFSMFFMSITMSLAALGDCIPAFSELCMVYSISTLYKKYGCVLKNYKAIDIFNSTDTVFIENFNYFLNSMPKIKTFYINNSFYSPDEIPEQSRNELIKYAVASMMAQPKSRRYTDIALVKYARELGIDSKSIANEFIYINKYCAEINAVLAFNGGDYSVISRGFAADMLKRCTTVCVNGSVREIGRNERFTLQNHIHNMELDSQTVIAIVKKPVTFSSESQDCFIDLDKMTLLGLIGFYNPVSTEAVKSLMLCKKNDINVVLMENAPMGAYIDIAKSTSLVESDSLVADADTIFKADEGLLRAELKRYKIFSQLTQQQRIYITNLYKKNENVITCIPNSLSDIPTQAVSDASITAFDEKLPALNRFSDAVFLNKNFSVFTALVKYSRAIYHNATRMLLFILTNQFLISALTLAGMIFENRLIFRPATLLLYGVFSIFPAAISLCCCPPPADKPLAAPNYNRYIFHFLSLIPPPFIVGLSGGISTVLVYRIYSAFPKVAVSAALITLFASTLLIAISLRNDELFIYRKLTGLFWISILISVLALTLVFSIDSLGLAFNLEAPNIEMVFISILFSLIPFAISEIIKKAKNLTK